MLFLSFFEYLEYSIKICSLLRAKSFTKISLQVQLSLSAIERCPLSLSTISWFSNKIFLLNPSETSDIPKFRYSSISFRNFRYCKIPNLIACPLLGSFTVVPSASTFFYGGRKLIFFYSFVLIIF